MAADEGVIFAGLDGPRRERLMPVMAPPEDHTAHAREAVGVERELTRAEKEPMLVER